LETSTEITTKMTLMKIVASMELKLEYSYFLLEITHSVECLHCFSCGEHIG
jgi:hypothetical protein